MADRPLENPFLAVRPFRRKDAPRFYGRAGDLVLVKSRLYTSRTTLLFAGSGVGKTSFLDACLTPALEDQCVLVTHRSWATDTPLEALRSSIQAVLPALDVADGTPLAQFERIVASRGKTRKCLLILDQFEEVFQHWRDSNALDAFAEEIARIVYADSIDGRVLISMREEFLGELSLFDNLIPDLFNNCYRLKNPTRAEAEEIITKTAASEQDIKCGSGLEPLLDDLLDAPRVGMSQPMSGKPPGHSRVPMPFLQIVCHRLWAQQLGGQRGSPPKALTEFLASHRPGDAAVQLKAYCLEKVNALTSAEQHLAAAAFGLLMTPRGAKMAYPVDVLANQAKVQEAPLREVLLKLCTDDVRIVREIQAGSDSTPWFELYHDLYARFLSEWKLLYDSARKLDDQRYRQQQAEESEKRRRGQIEEAVAQNEQRRLKIYLRRAGFTAALVVVTLMVGSTVFAYFRHYRPLVRFATTVTSLPDADAYLAARASADALTGFWLPFSKSARQLWAHYWQQRAQLEMLSGATDDALLSEIRSLQEDDTDETVRRQLSSWQAFGETIRIFRSPGRVLSVGFMQGPFKNARLLYASVDGCGIVFWDHLKGTVVQEWDPPPKFDDCRGVQAVSPNGVYAVLASSNRISLVDLNTREEIWGRDDPSLLKSTASFVPDSRRVVIQAGKTVTLVTIESRPDGGSTAAYDLVKPASASRPTYQYSPFTGNLIAHSGDRLVIYPPDGSGAGRAIDLKDTPLASLDVAATVFPLPADRFALVRSSKVSLFSATEPPKEVFDGGSDEATFALTPDGTALYVSRQSDDVICKLAFDRGICEPYAAPLWERSALLWATSADTVIVGDPSNRNLREVRLVRSAMPAAGSLGKDRTLLQVSADGHWILARGSDGCYLVDLEKTLPDRQLSNLCSEKGQRYVFSPLGGRLFDQGEGNEPAGLIDPVRFDPVRFKATPLSVSNEAASWVSDNYLAFRQADGGLALLNVATNRQDSVSSEVAPAFRRAAVPPPSAVQRPLPGCATAPGPTGLIVSRDDNHALLLGPTGLTLFEKSNSSWSTSMPLAATAGAKSTGFSPNSSFFSLLNGGALDVWATDGAKLVASLGDITGPPVCDVSFGPGARSVFAVYSSTPSSFAPTAISGELLFWELDESLGTSSRAPSWRASALGPLALLSNVGFPSPVLLAGRLIAWASTPGSAKVNLQVRPTPAGLIVPPLSGALSQETRLANDGSVRVVVQNGNGSVQYTTFDPAFTDLQPSAPPASKSWRDVYQEWSLRLDRRLNEESGVYEIILAPAASAAAAPPVRQPGDK